MASKSKFQKLSLPSTGAVSRRNSFQGLTVVADYVVGDQRILVMERPEGGTPTATKRKSRLKNTGLADVAAPQTEAQRG